MSVLQVIGMVLLIGILKMVMIKVEAMIEMVVHEVAVIDMEVEDQGGVREEATGRGRVLTIALVGEADHHPSIATKSLLIDNSYVHGT